MSEKQLKEEKKSIISTALEGWKHWFCQTFIATRSIETKGLNTSLDGCLLD